jgi:AcrR family transcriptional regulator
MVGKRAEQAERADAARNRRRVLEAAEKLFARHGADRVTMEEIARAAGAGKGTLYRRYPDRAAIAVALLAGGGRGQDEGRLDALADALLAPLAPELYRYRRQRQGPSWLPTPPAAACTSTRSPALTPARSTNP